MFNKADQCLQKAQNSAEDQMLSVPGTVPHKVFYSRELNIEVLR